MDLKRKEELKEKKKTFKDLTATHHVHKNLSFGRIVLPNFNDIGEIKKLLNPWVKTYLGRS